SPAAPSTATAALSSTALIDIISILSTQPTYTIYLTPSIKAAATIKEGNDTKPEEKSAPKSLFTNAGDTTVKIKHGANNGATGLFLYDGKAVKDASLDITDGVKGGPTGATVPTVNKNNGTVTVDATSATVGDYTLKVKYTENGTAKAEQTITIKVEKATITSVAYSTATGTSAADGSTHTTAVNSNAVTWTTPNSAPAGVKYTLKKDSPKFTPAAGSASSTAFAFPKATVVESTGALSIAASSGTAPAVANKGTYTWTVVISSTNYEDKEITYVYTLS
ncbi:hypothetical protein, partial [Mobiluncus mulieris]|uniref:hypothetical protein n=1 Tax=Mobiluncus mulieris TaxID=2052 RepID=UPI001B8D5177